MTTESIDAVGIVGVVLVVLGTAADKTERLHDDDDDDADNECCGAAENDNGDIVEKLCWVATLGGGRASVFAKLERILKELTTCLLSQQR